MADLIHGTQNYIIVGKREYGKATLLRQIALSLINLSDTLSKPAAPCLVEYSEIKRGSGRFYRLLRAQLPDTDGYDFAFDDLVKNGNIVILIDDVDFSDEIRRGIVIDLSNPILPLATSLPSTQKSFRTSESPSPSRRGPRSPLCIWNHSIADRCDDSLSAGTSNRQWIESLFWTDSSVTLST